MSVAGIASGILTALNEFHAGKSSHASSQSSGSQNFQSELSQLGEDLKSGNLPAAQRDYSTIQLDLMQHSARAHGHHHHSSASQDSSSAQQPNPVAQAFAQLAQDLGSGNLQASQADFAVIQNALTQLGGAASTGSNAARGVLSPAASSALNLVV